MHLGIKVWQHRKLLAEVVYWFLVFLDILVQCTGGLFGHLLGRRLFGHLDICLDVNELPRVAGKAQSTRHVACKRQRFHNRSQLTLKNAGGNVKNTPRLDSRLATATATL